MSTDLLLLNASNYPGQPVFPYAFVQVSALARTRGLTTARLDLLGVDPAEWPDRIARAVACHQPRMVGFHVRQADSQYLGEYQQGSTYFPVDHTRTLIGLVRGVTDVPVVVGGFGFTLHAERMFPFLGADYGVMGGPDGFFDAFDRLAARDLRGAEAVSNLLFHEEGVVRAGPRVYHPPLSEPEWDDALLDELRAFYAERSIPLSRDGDRAHADVPVEILRGCPCRCYFCTEPSVKGRRLQPRPLDTILADVAFLAERGIRVVWFVCSEINMGGMAFALALTERMAAFNATRGDERVLWRAYAMPKPGMSPSDLATMIASGYLPGWNEFTSFDDENLRACRMPYRAADAVAYYRTLDALAKDPARALGVPASKFEMFLGNAFMTPEAMRRTLEVVDREGFGDRFLGDGITATRVYAIDGRWSCGDPEAAFTIGPAGEQPIDLLHPTFHHAPALVAALGGRAEVDTFVEYASATFLTRRFQVESDAAAFLASVTDPDTFAAHLAEQAAVGLLVARHLRGRSPHAAEADALGERIWGDPIGAAGALWDPRIPAAVRSAAARTILGTLQRVHKDRMEPMFAALGLADPHDRRTPYRVMRVLYGRFDDAEAVVRSLALDPGAVEELLVRWFLFANNVRIVPAYRPLLFGQEPLA